ncbi:MAG: RcnB family protein [Pseudomonadota bacterium]
MRKLIITALMVATAVPILAPSVANAQSQREVNRDRHDIREQRRDVREARQELREDVRDRNRAWGRNDWRGYRDHNRGIYARGNWNAPFRYTAFRPGIRIAPSYFGSRYYIADPWRYRLPLAGRYQRWVRHYNDVILVDTRRGIVIDVIRNFYW